MGENTTERQSFIIENLRIDQDIDEEMFEDAGNIFLSYVK